jgi:hypothetical protein
MQCRATNFGASFVNILMSGMMQKNYSEPIIKYERRVKLFFLELIDTLFEQRYFAFRTSAKEYVDAMKNYIETTIHISPPYSAPSYFDRYQTGMYYITYRPNRYTTWYIFFRNRGNRYLICYITNNHFEGQYIR